MKDNEQKMFIHTKGCVPQFEKWLQENLTVVAGIFIGIALLQVNKQQRALKYKCTLNILCCVCPTINISHLKVKETFFSKTEDRSLTKCSLLDTSKSIKTH